MTGENSIPGNALPEAKPRRAVNKWEWLLYPVPALIFIGVWQAYTANDPKTQFIFSSPKLVLDKLVELTANGTLLRHAEVTVFEALCGFLLGTTIGAAIGLSLWYSKLTAKVARPYIAALASVPIFALAPMLIVWFGIGIMSKIMLAFLSTVAVAIVQSYQGAMSADKRHVRLMQVINATRWQTFKFLIVPSAIIWVINAMKLNIGLALLGAFIGEFISAEEGLGYMIVKASGLYDMATVLAGVFALIVIALSLTAVVEQIENRLLRWRRP